MRPNKKAAEVASWAAHEANPDRRAYLFGLAEALERGGWPEREPRPVSPHIIERTECLLDPPRYTDRRTA